LGDQPAEQGFQPVVAAVVQVIGLGGGKQHTIDPPPAQRPP
jgi:hypothetical protein